MKLLVTFALLGLSNLAFAQTAPRVLFDTDRGMILLQLDAVRAPNTVANFLSYVADGSYDLSLIHHIEPEFILQGGGFGDDGQAIVARPVIASERNNGLHNTQGTIALALTGDPPDVDSGTSGWFINTGPNTELDLHFTVFGQVVFGFSALNDMNSAARIEGTNQPIRPPLIRRAVRVADGEFPILAQHTGAWYDTDNSGRGILLEVTQAAGSEAGPLLALSWYDYFEGEQAWFTGMAPFEWGAHEVVVTLQVTRGGEFGADFDAAQVIANPAWGTIRVRFLNCGNGEFTYESDYGNGSMSLTHLTQPTDTVCSTNF